MQTIGEFHQKNPDVLGHRHNHLANGLGLRVVTVFDLVELGHAIDEHGNLFTKVFTELIERVVSVFHCVVQQSSNDGDGANPQVGEDLRDGQRVGDVRLAALAGLTLMRLLGDLVCPLYQAGVRLGVILANGPNKRVKALRCRRLREKPGQKRTQARGRGSLQFSHRATPSRTGISLRGGAVKSVSVSEPRRWLAWAP